MASRLHNAEIEEEARFELQDICWIRLVKRKRSSLHKTARLRGVISRVNSGWHGTECKRLLLFAHVDVPRGYRPSLDKALPAGLMVVGKNRSARTRLVSPAMA